jgi:uncharacterized protein
LITKLLPEEITYDGTQLGSRFFKETAGKSGDAALAFFGSADVPTENLVDEEDRAAGAIIKSDRMVHFLIRLTSQDLRTAVAFQRLAVAGVMEILIHSTSPSGFFRDGDDIYFAQGDDKRKLTVSIATTNRTGDAFIHIGVNVTGEGAPVPAIGLNEVGIDENIFTAEALAVFAREAAGIARAAAKVRPVE